MVFVSGKITTGRVFTSRWCKSLKQYYYYEVFCGGNLFICPIWESTKPHYVEESGFTKDDDYDNSTWLSDGDICQKWFVRQCRACTNIIKRFYINTDFYYYCQILSTVHSGMCYTPIRAAEKGVLIPSWRHHKHVTNTLYYVTTATTSPDVQLENNVISVDPHVRRPLTVLQTHCTGCFTHLITRE